MSVCRHCGARIRWVRTAKRGRLMPLDIKPTPLGNVILRPVDSAAVVLDMPDRDIAVSRGAVVYRPHFASCPNREKEIECSRTMT